MNGHTNKTWAQVKRIVKKHGGWFEGDVARFPSPFNMEQCQKELAA